MPILRRLIAPLATTSATWALACSPPAQPTNAVDSPPTGAGAVQQLTSAPTGQSSRTAGPTPTLDPTAAAEPAPTAPLTATEKVDVPAPGPDWTPAPLERARGYVSVYFGSSGAPGDTGSLRPLAAWSRGERGVIRLFRRVDPQTGAPVAIALLAPEKSSPKPRPLPDGMSWYEWPSDGTQLYWVTSGSLVLSAEDSPLARAPQLAADLRRWAPKVLSALAPPPTGP